MIELYKVLKTVSRGLHCFDKVLSGSHKVPQPGISGSSVLGFHVCHLRYEYHGFGLGGQWFGFEGSTLET